MGERGIAAFEAGRAFSLLLAGDVSGKKSFLDFISSGVKGETMRDAGTTYEVVESDGDGRTVRTTSPSGASYDADYDNKGHRTR